jgi:hypothetical protein
MQPAAGFDFQPLTDANIIFEPAQVPSANHSRRQGCRGDGIYPDNSHCRTTATLACFPYDCFCGPASG